MGTLSLKKASDRIVAHAPVVKTPNTAYRSYILKNYPAVFDTGTPKPLRLGVHDELIKSRPPWATRPVVRRFLLRWTYRWKYWEVIANGGNRFGLDGKPDGTVSEEHRARAVSKLKRPKSGKST